MPKLFRKFKQPVIAGLLTSWALPPLSPGLPAFCCLEIRTVLHRFLEFDESCGPFLF